MAAGSMVHCQLWMGGLESYMTESFILASFERMGEKPLNVKVMRNKFTGEPAGYCFVHFENDDEAIDAMHKLNGKVIPNTNPPVRFRLNTATNQGKIMMNDREFSLWVGDLSSEVDDYTLYKTFAAKYVSLKAAKVILDHSGYSKGFGFLRFGSEDEQKHCLNHMNGYKGLGTKPIKISNAIPKTQRNSASNGQQQTQQSGNYQYPQDYSHYYDPNSYWQNYSQWGGYSYDPNTGYSYDPSSYAAAQQYGSSQYQTQYGQYPPSSTTGYPNQQSSYGSYTPSAYSSYYPSPQGGTAAPPPTSMTSNSAPPPSGHGSAAASSAATVDEANEIVEHSIMIDVEKENREYAESILNHWTEVASNSMLDPDLFQDEMSKMNIIDVSIPRVTVKFENRTLARMAVLAQEPSVQLDSDIVDLCNLAEASSREGSEEPSVKKRKLSTDEPMEEQENQETKEAETENKDVQMEAVEEPDSEETKERRAKLKEEWAKAKIFMADLDVVTMMAETESVSSESTRISDDDIESVDNGDECQVLEAPVECEGEKNIAEEEVQEENSVENVLETEATNRPIDDSMYEPEETAMDEDQDSPEMETIPEQPTVSNDLTVQEPPRRQTRSRSQKLAALVENTNAQANLEITDVTQCEDEPVNLVEVEPIVDEDSLDDKPLSARLEESSYPVSSRTEEFVIEDCSDSRISGSESVEEVAFKTTVISDDSRSADAVDSMDASNFIDKLVNGEEDSLVSNNQDAENSAQSDSDSYEY